jgi:mono/diheme cytochrome c family protein
MQRVSAVASFLLLCLPLVAAAQTSSSTAPLSLTITDIPAVEQWSRATQGGLPLDPTAPRDTAFLLSLNETQRLGAFRFKQRCDVCHGVQMSLAPNTWGPLLSNRNVTGREEAVRRQILEGSARMPAFKYALPPAEVDAIVDYLKQVGPPAP